MEKRFTSGSIACGEQSPQEFNGVIEVLLRHMSTLENPMIIEPVAASFKTPPEEQLK